MGERESKREIVKEDAKERTALRGRKSAIEEGEREGKRSEGNDKE